MRHCRIKSIFVVGYSIISLYADLLGEGVFAMTDREAQIEALWTYEISTEKILRRAVKKEFISQTEADRPW